MEKNLNDIEISNIKVEVNPDISEKQAEENITKFLEKYRKQFENYCSKLEIYRTYFKKILLKMMKVKLERTNLINVQKNLISY